MLLEVRDLQKSFGGVAAVAGATFDVAEGSITALIGPNGAGKSTAFNAISGFVTPDGGRVRFNGIDISGKRGDTITRAGLVRVFQNPRVLKGMSVLDNLMLAAPAQPGERLLPAFVGGERVAAREREVLAESEEVIELLRLGHVAHEMAGNLSGGQRKLVDLGRALMVRPRMILLDEPMAGVAPVLAEQLVEHIRMLRAERGMTVFVVEHDMDMVMAISDRVIVMDEGRVIAEGRPAEIQGNERVVEAYLGTFASGVPA